MVSFGEHFLKASFLNIYLQRSFFGLALWTRNASSVLFLYLLCLLPTFLWISDHTCGYKYLTCFPEEMSVASLLFQTVAGNPIAVVPRASHLLGPQRLCLGLRYLSECQIHNTPQDSIAIGIDR